MEILYVYSNCGKYRRRVAKGYGDMEFVEVIKAAEASEIQSGASSG